MMKTAITCILTTLLVTGPFTTDVNARRRPVPNDEGTASTAQPVQPAQPIGSSPNDTARFLAGMPVDPQSPLAPLTRTPAWQQHAESFEAAFAKLVRGKFARLHNWQIGRASCRGR